MLVPLYWGIILVAYGQRYRKAKMHVMIGHEVDT